MLKRLTILAVLCVLISCAGARARSQMFGLLQTSTPTVEHHVNTGVQAGLFARKISETDAAKLQLSMERLKSAIIAKDADAIEENKWLVPLHEWAKFGVKHRVKLDELGPGVGEMVGLEIDKFFELLAKVIKR